MTEQFYVDGGKKVVMISRAKNDPAMVILAYTNVDHGATEAMLLKDIVADGNTYESVVNGYNDLPPQPLGEDKQQQLDGAALELITLRVLYGPQANRIKELEGELRLAAAQHGQGIDLPAGLSVSNTGAGVTERWNSAKLNALAKQFPAINEARTQGIRNAGGRVNNLKAVTHEAKIKIGDDFFHYFSDDLAMAENMAIGRLVRALIEADEEDGIKGEMIAVARRHAALNSYKQAEENIKAQMRDDVLIENIEATVLTLKRGVAVNPEADEIDPSDLEAAADLFDRIAGLTDEATTRAVADKLGIPAGEDVVGIGLEGVIAEPDTPPARDLDIDAGLPELGQATLTQQPPDSAPTGGGETEGA